MVAVLTTVLTIVGITIALATARRPARVRLWLDATRITVALVTTVLLGVLLGVAPSPLVAVALFTLGLALGWWQGTTSEVFDHGGVLLQRRRLVGVAVWGGAVLVVQLAAYASLTGTVSLGQSVAWFGVGAQIALPVARTARIRELTAATATLVLLAAVPLLAVAGVASAETHPRPEQIVDGVYTAQIPFPATGSHEYHRTDVVFTAAGGSYRLQADVDYTLKAGTVDGFTDCLVEVRVRYDGTDDIVDSTDTLAAIHFVGTYVREIDNPDGCNTPLDPRVDDSFGEAWIDLSMAYDGAPGAFTGSFTGFTYPIVLDVDTSRAAAGSATPRSDGVSGTDGATPDATAGQMTDDVSAAEFVGGSTVITLRQAQTAAGASAAGVMLFGALSLVEVSGTRRRRVLVGGDPAVGTLVDVDEAERYDLYATSGGQKATGEQRFGRRGRVVGSQLHVEDAEAGPDGTRRRLTEVEVDEVGAVPGDGAPTGTGQPPPVSGGTEPLAPSVEHAAQPPPVPAREPDGPGTRTADEEPGSPPRQAPVSEEQPPPVPPAPVEELPVEEASGDEDAAEEAAEEAAPGGGHPLRVAPMPDGGAEAGPETAGVQLSEQEIDDAVTRARLGGWETDELQRYLDGLNEARGGSGAVPMPDIEVAELPDGRRVIATAEEIASYRDARTRLEQWERYDAYVFEQYQEADAAKRKWVELQAAPELRFMATMKQVLGEVSEFNARIDADEQAIESIVAQRYDGTHPRELVSGTRLHWEASRRLEEWMRHEVDVLERLDRIRKVSEERDWRVRQLLGTPGSAPRPETDTSGMRPVNRMWEQVNRVFGNTVDREVELPGGTTAEETSMAHRPGMKIAEFEEVIDGLIAQRRSARTHMDELRGLIQAFENPVGAPEG